MPVVVACAALAAPAAASTLWKQKIDNAARYVQGRAGVVSFAVVDESGRLHGYRAAAVAPSASVLKAMLLVAYLRKASVRDRALRAWERELLGPMIRRSDNAAASAVLGLVGSSGVMRLARVTGMRRFRLRVPIWGLSEITAADQARYFYHVDAYVPVRHRAYALRLLATIVPSQRWGVGRVPPPGWRLYFKGGWGSGTGLVDHQVALLTGGRERVSLAILTRFNPSHAYGKETLRGVAARLLAGLPKPVLALPPAARFAYDSGYAASLDEGCASLRIRSLVDGSRTVIPTALASCDSSVQLALGGSRALWSWTESSAGATHVSTAALEAPEPTEVGTLGSEDGTEVLRSAAGAGETLVFSHDSYGSDGSFLRGEITSVTGGSCQVPERAIVGVAAGRLVVASGGAIEVRAADTCELLASLTSGGLVEAAALGGDLVATLSRDPTGAMHIERYRISTSKLLGATRVPLGTARKLQVAGRWVLYRVGTALKGVTVLSGARWTLWQPRESEIGWNASGRQVAWLSGSSGRAQLWVFRLPG
jgi:hypothetical protein